MLERRGRAAEPPGGAGALPFGEPDNQIVRELQATTEETVETVRSALGVILSSSYLLERPTGLHPGHDGRHYRRIADQVARADQAVGRLLSLVRALPTVAAHTSRG